MRVGASRTAPDQEISAQPNRARPGCATQTSSAAASSTRCTRLQNGVNLARRSRVKVRRRLTTVPAHLPRWLFWRVLAYRLQAAALGGLDKETLRVIRQPKGQTVDSRHGRPFEARIPATREGATLGAGSLLTREWNGKLERVMVLEKGFAWNGKSYGSLSQIAKAMTGTSWSGHRFFGLRAAKSGPLARALAGTIAVAHPEECGRDAATSP